MENIKLGQSHSPMIPNDTESNQIVKSSEISQIINDKSNIGGLNQGTNISSLGFLDENQPKIFEKEIQKDDTISVSTGTDSNSSKQLSDTSSDQQSGKSKGWAGNLWSYIRNLFPKTEYLIYRNVNGDMVKVPKQKIPLKKKKKKNNINFNIKMEQEKKQVINKNHGATNDYFM